jgi:hypothetical protein
MGRIRDEDKPAEVAPDERRQRPKLHSLRGPERTGECHLCGASLFGRVRKCPNCGTLIEQPAPPPRPKPAASDRARAGVPVSRDRLGAYLIAAAVFAALIAWVWIARLSLLQAPMLQLATLSAAVFILSGVLVYRDACQLGIGREPDGDGRLWMRPAYWALAVAFLYPVAAPIYFRVRARHGSDSPAYMGIAATAVLAASLIIIGLGINSRAEGARREAERLTRQSEWIMSPSEARTN